MLPSIIPRLIICNQFKLFLASICLFKFILREGLYTAASKAINYLKVTGGDITERRDAERRETLMTLKQNKLEAHKRSW